MKLSVVLPTFNEEKNIFFEQILKSAQAYELLLCDGGSQDKTLEIAKSYNVKVFENAGRFRSERLNKGIQEANGDIVVLHHPRSLLEDSAFNSLIEVASEQSNIKWGAFTHCFDQKHPLLKFTSFYSNYIRPKTQGIYYLDHCIYYVPSRLNKLPTMPKIPIFEDTELSLILKRQGRPHRMPQLSVTSSLRFSKNGIFTQAVLNQVMKAMYLAGFSKEKMDLIYEAGLKLNSK